MHETPLPSDLLLLPCPFQLGEGLASLLRCAWPLHLLLQLLLQQLLLLLLGVHPPEAL